MQIAIIAHNIRSVHNIGSVFRTCDGFGVSKLYMTGYTPYPTVPGDKRLRHIHTKLTAQIHKTALGAEQTVAFEHKSDIHLLLGELRSEGFYLCALEQHPKSKNIREFWQSFSKIPTKLALVVGNEVSGIEDCLEDVDAILEIPMHGKKESFNVAVAAGIALYALNLNHPTLLSEPRGYKRSATGDSKSCLRV